MIKKYLTTKNILLALLFVFLFLISYRLYANWSFPDTDWQLKRDDKIYLTNESGVLQKFTAKNDNLSKIEVLTGSSKIDGYIEMILLDEGCQEIFEKYKLKTSKMDSNQTYAFTFPRIKDSGGKTFCFSISSKAKKTGSKFPGVFVTDSPAPSGNGVLIYPDGQSFQSKSLSIRPGYRNATLSEDINELNQRISQYKPFFLKHHFLYSIAFLFIILSIGLVIILIRM